MIKREISNLIRLLVELRNSFGKEEDIILNNINVSFYSVINLSGGISSFDK